VNDVEMDAAADVAVDAPPGDAADATPADSTPCTPTTEMCNGRDDDCNGAIDEIAGCGMHLLISEIVSQPSQGEFIEIYNPTNTMIVLSNVYLTDWEQYYRFNLAAETSSAAANDFIARFPDGATIMPGEYQTVATGAADPFASFYASTCPTYTLSSMAATTCTTTATMRSVQGATSPTIGTSAGLTNGDEPITLFQWDGMSDLVQDLDYAYYGTASTTTNVQVNKTGVSIDGPDVDTSPTMYQPDTAPAMQQTTPTPPLGGSVGRCDFTEGAEVQTGGNGVSGDDETSEPLATTWRATAPIARPDGGMLSTANASPNAANTCR
jgi:hypothetical protein